MREAFRTRTGQIGTLRQSSLTMHRLRFDRTVLIDCRERRPAEGKQRDIDSEAVVYGAGGVPDFQQLRRELRPSRSGRVRYHAFLREGRWYEYVIPFALGGAAAVLTGLISSGFGASVGGLFLALPAIFCASARP